MSVEVSAFLEHHGVLGQKWGVRNKKRRVSGDAKKTAKVGRKRVSELTNNQLKAHNERRNLEQNFHRLNPGTITKGLAASAAFLSAIDLGVRAFNLFNSPAGRAAIQAGKKFVIKTR